MLVDQPIKVAADVASVGTVIATIAGWLPPIAALLSIVWLSMQIYGWIVNKKWRPPNEPKP